MKLLMERNNVMITVRNKTDFSIKHSDLVQNLNKLLQFEEGQQESAESIPEITKTVAMSSVAAIIKYLDLLSDPCNLGHYRVVTLNMSRYVKLHAFRTPFYF